MRNIFLVTILLFTIMACSSGDEERNELDCSAVDCQPGPFLDLIFLRNNENIQEIEPDIDIRIVESDEVLRDTFSEDNTTSVFLINTGSATIFIGNEEFNLEYDISNMAGGCCSSFTINSLKINDVEVCSSQVCSEANIIEINI